MNRLLGAILALLLFLSPALAFDPVGKYYSSPPTASSGDATWLLTDANGRLVTNGPVAGASTVAKTEDTPAADADVGTGVLWVRRDTNAVLTNTDGDYTTPAVNSAGSVKNVGDSLSLAADAGTAPVKMGCVFSTSAPSPANGNRVDCQASSEGGLIASPRGVSTALADGTSNTQNLSGVVTSGGTSAAGVSRMFPLDFNGTSWDRRFTCANSAVINVTAAATTQLVALVASQVVRVCSFVLTESLAGTAKFVYGTGSNCATGTTDLTGAMALGTNAAITIAADNGSLFRTIASNALCLTAVTGNITGFVTYAQY